MFIILADLYGPVISWYHKQYEHDKEWYMHVVIVGGGFGGVKAALELSKRHIGRITLISNHSYFLHHASLYATATGKSTEESVIPLNSIFMHHPQIEIVKDTIIGLDPHRKLVSSKKKDYHYDKLILALGSSTSFLNVKGIKGHAYGIKTLDEVREFQAHMQDEIIEQRLDKEFFVIGGGLTGVEVASALKEYTQLLVSLYRLKHADPRVTLVEASGRLVPRMSHTASRKISKRLKAMGVRVLLNQTVTALDGDNITIDGRVYPTKTAIWTSGTVPHSFFKTNAEYFNIASDGRVNVNPYLEALDDIYVIGDANTVKHSGFALPAFKQASHVAKNISRLASGRHQAPFRSRRGPLSVPVGAHWGYVEWCGLYVAGRTGAVLRRGLDLYNYCHIMPFSMALPIWRSHDVRDVDDIF